uniref:dUTPase-like domain-containing protein n=1 Tax=Catharus ustulatus TaxID=91951 RepID=A0A8C3V5D1_CATUS
MLAFPVTYTQTAGGLQANITSLDWKLLAQFRSTVGAYGVASEPARQMLDYIFSAFVLLPTDIKGIARLMFSAHQKLLFDAHWQQEAMRSVATQRGPADPLNASMQGLFVLPGVIDSDYTGELMIMAFTLFPPFTITKGQRIAQIIPLPQLTKGIAPLCRQPRQDKGFGSTGGLNSSHRRRLIPSSGCWQNFR